MTSIRVPLLLALLALVALPSCRGAQYAAVNPFAEQQPAAGTAPTDPNGWNSSVPRTDEVMYGWDGAPIGSGGPARTPEAGSVRITEGGLTHGLEGAQSAGGSRLVLLELYHQAVEEREELALEVEALNAALEQSERLNQDTELRLGELQGGYDVLSAEKSAVEEQRRELAARLTTAQVRRLQAEKAWLEAAIEWRDLAGKTAAGRARLSAKLTESSQ